MSTTARRLCLPYGKWPAQRPAIGSSTRPCPPSPPAATRPRRWMPWRRASTSPSSRSSIGSPPRMPCSRRSSPGAQTSCRRRSRLRSRAPVRDGSGWRRSSVPSSAWRLVSPSCSGFSEKSGGWVLRAATQMTLALEPLVQRASSFLQAEMDAGTMRRHDPGLLLLAIYSTVIGMVTEVEVLRALGEEPTARSLVRRRADVLQLLRSALLIEPGTAGSPSASPTELVARPGDVVLLSFGSIRSAWGSSSSVAPSACSACSRSVDCGHLRERLPFSRCWPPPCVLVPGATFWPPGR